MFVQVIQAKVTDPQGLRKQWDVWESEVKPNAEGFLGSTAGIAEDGTFIVGARFESEEAARRNSDRPEQSEWWQETERYLESPVFYDCTTIDEWGEGGSDAAGFVQVIQGYADRDAMTKLMQQMDEVMPNARKDVIGGYVAWGPNDGFSQFVYFTSEAEAREGEAQEMPPEAAEVMQQWDSSVRDLKYIDLKEPWFSSR